MIVAIGVSMQAIKPDITAQIRLYSTSQGGRAGATPSDHLGCIFVYQEENFECRILLHEIGAVHTGCDALVPIKFLAPELVKPRLQAGDQFTLREIKTIGEGAVKTVLE